jgi:adenylate cyclase
VLESHTFRAAGSQRAFLRFVSNEAIAGRGSEIKEYSIAIEAFGRGTDFDPRLDPIVRTQARKLRVRLAAYYETEGRTDAVQIELRKGSYAPRFHYAEPVMSAPAENLPATTAPLSEAATVPSTRQIAKRHRRRAIMAGAAISALCAAATFFLVRGGRLGPATDGERSSLAVTPLVNASGDANEQIWCDRLSMGLIDSLRRVPGLKVWETGKTRHVRSVLTGRFVKAGTRIRVRLKLSNALDGSRLWSGSYEGDAGDMQALEREVTDELVDVLRSP